MTTVADERVWERERASTAAPGTSEERSAAYDRACAACEEALAARPDITSEHFFSFGGRRVRMRVVGRELADRLTRPFAHLRSSDRAGDAPISLSIDVWDEREAHVPYPPEEDVDPTEIRWPAGQGLLAVSAGTRFVRYDCTAWVTWLDRAERRMIGWRANADRLAMHERTRPLPFLLPVWYADQGVHIIHAGLVARDGRGVLLCGANGAGKSTTSLACLCGGLEFLSDDHVGIEQTGNGSFIGHSIFASTRLEPDHLQRFPMLVPHAIMSQEWFETKSLILTAEVAPRSVTRSASIRAIALPTIVDAPSSRIEPVSRAEALRALAPSSMMQMPFGATHDRFRALAKLVASVPAYRLELGRDIGAIAPRVAELIDTLS